MKRATLIQRFIALLIDYILIALIVFPTQSYIFENAFEHPNKMTLILIILNCLFLAKDSTSQSPGKKVMNIKIVKKSDASKPSIALPFIRNIFLGLGIIEVAVILLDKNHERIGDKVTGTIVVQAA